MRISSAVNVLAILGALRIGVGGEQVPFLDTFEHGKLQDCWTVDSSRGAKVSVDGDRQVLVLEGLDNRYNHIEMQMPAGARYVQADVNNVNDTAASWSPAMILYWSEQNYARVMVSLTYSLRLDAVHEGEAVGKVRKTGLVPGTWYTVAFELDGDAIGILFAKQGEKLTKVGSLPRPQSWSKPPTLILGKGYMPKTGGRPDFDNNYGKNLKRTRVEYDNVVLGNVATVADELAKSVATRRAKGRHDPGQLQVAFWPNVTHPKTQKTLRLVPDVYHRLCLIYSNYDPLHSAEDFRIEIDAPPDLRVQEITFGPHRLDVTRTVAKGRTQVTIAPAGDWRVPPHFGGVALPDKVSPGWFSWPVSRLTPAVYVHCTADVQTDGKTIRARGVAASGPGPWREMRVSAMPPLPELFDGPKEHLGLSLWEGRLAHDSGEKRAVLSKELGLYQRVGVKRVHCRGDRQVIAAIKSAGITPFLQSWWHYSSQCPPSFQPTEAEKATERANSGSDFCPVIIAAGTGTYGEFLRSVTEKMESYGCDGFMLDYECRMPRCFDERCKGAFAAYTQLTDVDWPGDVKKGGRYYRQWIDFRCWQGALYVKAIRDAARAAVPACPMQAWLAGYDYNNTIERATIDVSKAARFLTEPETPHYTLPADYSDMWAAQAGLGSVETGIQTVQDTLDVVDKPTIFCSSIIYPLGNATPWSDPQILDAQIQTIIAQGARGVSFWGGHSEGALNGRFLHKMVKWHNLLAAAGEFLWHGERRDGLLELGDSDTQHLRRFAWVRGNSCLIAIVNLTQEDREVAVRVPKYSHHGVGLLTREQVDLRSTLTIPALDGRFVVIRKGA